MNRRNITPLHLTICAAGVVWVLFKTLKSRRSEAQGESEFDMGFFGSGDTQSTTDTRSGMCGGYDISASVLSPPITDAELEEARVARDRRLNEIRKLELAERVAATNKSSVKIGSLPRIPSWLLHLTLAIAAAGIVHLVIYFYGR